MLVPIHTLLLLQDLILLWLYLANDREYAKSGQQCLRTGNVTQNLPQSDYQWLTAA